MTNPSAEQGDREYIAFISYRHKPLDAEAARRIQKKIENYTVPKEYREKFGGKKLGMVFRDEDELPAASSLSGSIKYALDHTQYLLVICTPDLPKSAWCEQEIRYFLETHDRDHLLAILVDGDPAESFSPWMLHTFDEEGNITGDTEPLAANISSPAHKINNKAFRKEIVRVYAALLQCPFDALWQRQKRARTNRMAALMGLAALILSVFTGVVFSKNRQITAQNRQITEQNDRISEQNEEITDKNQELRKQLSSILVDSGRSLLEDHDVLGSLDNALAALPEEESQPYDPRAEALLAEALGAYQTDTIQSRIIYRQSLDIVDVKVTEDGEKVILADPLGYVRGVSLADGSQLWETLSRETPGAGEADTHLIIVPDTGIVIGKNGKRVVGLDTETGETLWQYDYMTSLDSNFYCLSPDGSRLLLLDQEEWSSPELLLVILDTKTGEQISRTALGAEETPLSLVGTTFRYGYGSGFSDDGKFFAFATGMYHQEGQYYCALLDTETWEILHTRIIEGSDSTTAPVFYGIRPQNGSGDIFCAQYESGYGGIMVTRIDWDSEENQRDLFNKTLYSDSGLLMDVLSENLFVPMITDDHYAVVFVQESMFLFDLSSGILHKGYAFQDSIVYADWEDRGESVLTLMTAGGAVLRYDLLYETGRVLEGMSSRSLDQNALALALPLPDTNAYGLYLTVPSDHRERLLLVRSITDPGSESIEETQDRFYSLYRVMQSPSGQRIFFFLPGGSGETLILCCEAGSLAEVSRLTIPTQYDQVPMILDDESFILGNRILGMDGSEQYLDKLTEDKAEDFPDRYFKNCRLYNGQTLTAFYCFYSTENTWIPCWIDGKLVQASQEKGSGIAFQSCEDITVGENGYVIGYGDLAAFDAGGTSLKDSPEAFYAFNALEGTRQRIEDPFPEAGERIIVAGRRTPVMACMNEDSMICLLSLDDGSAWNLPTAYAAGEVKDLCFTPDDQYLTILTQSGNLDIYDLNSREKVYSETPSLFTKVGISQVKQIRCCLDEESGRLLFLCDYNGDPCGPMIIMDPENWTVLGQAHKVYDYLAADRKIYAQRSNQMVRYPFHSLEDLEAMAQTD